MDNFEEIKKNIKNHFRVSIFGSAKVQDGDDTYRRVKHLAEELGKRNIDVITGGGPGLMKAASEGHKIGSVDNDADTIGIGVDLPWKQQFNDSVEYREQLPIFSKRLDEFMLLSNAAIVEPGGLGTLLELFYTWQLAQVHHICNIPIILIGEDWEGLLRWIKDYPLAKKYLSYEDYNLVFHVKNTAEALELIDEAYESFKKGGENFCLNYKKYKID